MGSRLLRVWPFISHADTGIGLAEWAIKLWSGATGGWLMTAVGWLADIGPFWWTLGSLGGIAAGLVIGDEITWRRFNRKAPKQLDTTKGTTAETIGAPTSTEQLPVWVGELLVEQRTQLDRFVVVISSSIDFSNVGKRVPFLEFQFEIFNGSMFRVNIDTTGVKGKVEYRGERFEDSASVSSSTMQTSYLSPGARGEFKLHQAIRPGDQNDIMGNSGRQAEFGISGLHITLLGRSPSPDSREVRHQLSLPPSIRGETPPTSEMGYPTSS